jgi:hypothetical protein
MPGMGMGLPLCSEADVSGAGAIAGTGGAGDDLSNGAWARCGCVLYSRCSLCSRPVVAISAPAYAALARCGHQLGITAASYLTCAAVAALQAEREKKKSKKAAKVAAVAAGNGAAGAAAAGAAAAGAAAAGAAAGAAAVTADGEALPKKRPAGAPPPSAATAAAAAKRLKLPEGATRNVYNSLFTSSQTEKPKETYLCRAI